jgi:hypothetical protein
MQNYDEDAGGSATYVTLQVFSVYRKTAFLMQGLTA